MTLTAATTVSPPAPLSDPLVTALAARFRVVGEPMRIRLLDRLRHAEASVGELVEALGAGQQNISRHLNVLHAAGIVSRRRLGTRVIYAIADLRVLALCDAACGSLPEEAEPAEPSEPPAHHEGAVR